MLTPLQDKCNKFLLDFIAGDERCCTIAGYAGAGKTYVLQHFINNYITKNIAVSAFTHKAVDNIVKDLSVPGHTVHSLLGLAPNMNLDTFDPNSPSFSLQFDEKIQGYKYLVVDECSQIGSKLFEYLIERAIRYNVKIIYVGDPCQLPPINEIVSLTFKTKNLFWLTEIIRQNHTNPVLPILTMLRDDVFKGTSVALNYLMVHKESINKEGEGYNVVTEAQFFKNLSSVIKSDELYTPDDFRFTAYTRQTVDTTNIKIHLEKYKNVPNSKMINVGDFLTSHKTVVDNYLSPLIINSLDYVVTDVLEFTTSDDIVVFAVKLKNGEHNNLRNQTFYIVKHELDNIKKLIALLKPMTDLARSLTGANRRIAWKEYFKVKEQYLLLFDVDFGGIKLEKDISYGYGLTTYKTQGSTYKNVFTNMLDITCYKAKPYQWITDTPDRPYSVILRNKHMYVALSRASKHNTILL